MPLETAASRLTHKHFLQNNPQFHWRHPDGTEGPPIGVNYETAPVQPGYSLDDILNYSDISLSLQIQLITANGKGDRAVAKIMKPSPDDLRLKNELNILKSLRHKHIAAVLGNFSLGSRRNELEYGILVSPLAAKNLQDLLEDLSEDNKDREERSLDWEVHENTHKLLPYFASLCETVLFLHKHTLPIEHRDIKPANILIDRDNNVILTEFDISRAYGNIKKTIIYESMDGTITYTSRNVWQSSMDADLEGSKRRLQWDVISLGYVFLEMATVLFGKTLEDMREPMKTRSNEGLATVVYSESDKEIKVWLDSLGQASDHFVRLTKSEPEYVRRFLTAIEDMTSAKQHNGDSLERALETFGCLSKSCCPGRQSR
jgi:serine/threonine protein kinase